MTEWTYLNDGLYARFDGWQIELRANDPNEPENDTVYLEFETATAFIKYAKRVFDTSEPVSDEFFLRDVPAASNYEFYGNCSICGLSIADDEDVHNDYYGLDCHAACCPVCKDEVLLNG